MIKSIKGDTAIHGSTWELTFELHHLIRQLSVVCPEILCAVLYKDNKHMRKAILASDPTELEVIEHLIDMIEEERKNLNND